MRLRACARMLLAAGIVLVAASAVGAGKKQQPSRPFWGSTSGEVHFEYTAECQVMFGFAVSEAEGELTHLGRTTFASRHCAGGGTAVFTAANGDEAFLTAAPGTFQVTKFDPPRLMIEEGEYTVTGGTGRFQSASGTLAVTVYITPAPFPPGPSTRWPVEIVFVGTISY